MKDTTRVADDGLEIGNVQEECVPLKPAARNSGFSQKERLVFVHGWATDREVWKRQIVHFSENNDCLSINLPGHICTSNWSEATLKPAIDLLLAAVANRSSGRDLIGIGWSLGAEVILKTAAARPSLFKGIVLVGATPCFVQRDGFPWGQSKGIVRRMAIDIGNAPHETLKRFYPLNLTEDEISSPEGKWFVEYYSRISRGFDHISILNALYALLYTDIREELGVIDIPALIITGGCDRVVPPAAGSYIAGRMINSKEEIIKGAGHLPFLTMAGEFNRILSNFIIDCNRSSMNLQAEP